MRAKASSGRPAISPQTDTGVPESAQACQEALEEVSEFLFERYPNMFKKVVEGDRTSIQNCMTGERFDIGGAASGGEGIDALEAAVRLTMEDLSILMMNKEGEYYLYGSHFTFFLPIFLVCSYQYL